MGISSRSTCAPLTTQEVGMTEEPTTEELKLVARHGNGDLERSLAVVQLAKQRNRLDKLMEIVEA